MPNWLVSKTQLNAWLQANEGLHCSPPPASQTEITLAGRCRLAWCLTWVVDEAGRSNKVPAMMNQIRACVEGETRVYVSCACGRWWVIVMRV